MISIQIETDSKRFACIQSIAEQTWPIAYGKILTEQQIRYMLDRTYCVDSMQKQVEIDQHRFLLASNGLDAVGFASFSVMPQKTDRFRLHKLYVLPLQQGNGIGRLLLEEISRLISNKESVELELNVNRFNSARYFYESQGFRIIREEDIDIGQGFFMNDYVMEKSIPGI